VYTNYLRDYSTNPKVWRHSLLYGPSFPVSALPFFFLL